jgi:hypothetical protein
MEADEAKITYMLQRKREDNHTPGNMQKKQPCYKTHHSFYAPLHTS